MILSEEHLGTIYFCGNDIIRTIKEIADQDFVNMIGEQISPFYGK